MRYGRLCAETERTHRHGNAGRQYHCSGYRAHIQDSACQVGTLPSRAGAGGFDTLVVNGGFIICHSDATLASLARLTPWTPPPLEANASLTFFCSFRGDLGVHPEGFARPTQVKSGELAIFHVPGPQASFQLPPTHQRTISGGFSLDFLRAVTAGLELPHSLAGLLEDGKTAPLVQQGRLDARYALILDDLLRCPYAGAAGQLYRQSKGLELLSCLSQYWSVRKAVRYERWRCADVERLYEARERLLADLGDPPSLLELAAAVGLSPTQLKQGFRDIFASTVTDTLREMRLQTARRLLEQTGLPLKTVAAQVGYSDAASLSHAFRTRFGLSPGAMRH